MSLGLKIHWRTAVAALAGLVVLAGVSRAEPPAEAPKIEFAAHRAVYTLSLERSSPGSNVSDVQGELVYDFKGSACEGYTLNTRLVTTIYDRDGKPSTQDLRSETFEKADGSLYRFNNSQYVDEKISDMTKGKAFRPNGSPETIMVEIEKPKKMQKSLSGHILFPTQHSFAVVKAAVKGETHLLVDLYDGSEKGLKLFETSTLIGREVNRDAAHKLPPVKNGESLDGVPSWPVLISYYDDTQNKDGVPSYEISFRLYANGVSRKLLLNYGVFSLSGDLVSIDFSPGKPCSAEQAAKTSLQEPVRQ